MFLAKIAHIFLYQKHNHSRNTETIWNQYNYSTSRKLTNNIIHKVRLRLWQQVECFPFVFKCTNFNLWSSKLFFKALFSCPVLI